jgi:N-acetyl-anhydromuramyl-L-alanine amidase AmpD
MPTRTARRRCSRRRGTRRRTKKSSAHFIVGQSGQIIQSVQIRDIAYHAHSADHAAIGIEHCAREPREFSATDPGMPPTDVQYAASARLVAWLLMRCGLSATRWVIQGHAQIDPRTTHTGCPDGCGWDWGRYMELVATEYEGLQQ